MPSKGTGSYRGKIPMIKLPSLSTSCNLLTRKLLSVSSEGGGDMGGYVHIYSTGKRNISSSLWEVIL